MPSYREELEAWAKTAGSDGCSVVPEFFRVCCLAHDYMYATGKTPRGVFVTKVQADQMFRDCIQRHSSFQWLSPLSWWRWFAVRRFGRGIWQQGPPRPFLNGSIYDTQVALRRAAEARRVIYGELFL